MYKPLYTLSWMVGLMLAPHSLVLLGNLTGAYQYDVLVWLLPAAILYWINVASASKLARASQAPTISYNRPFIEFMKLASRGISTISLSTVLLVTAGFVFNETFVYWFPNFAFAFILLGSVLTVQLCGSKAGEKLQLLMTVTVVLGLVVLIILGLVGSDADLTATTSMAQGYRPHGVVAVLLLFVGFDLAIGTAPSKFSSTARVIKLGVFATAVLMGLWGWVSLLHVPVEKLSGSFIPHLLTARYVQGDVGRNIMGAIVISGSVAAVNTLLRSLVELISDLTNKHLANRKKSFRLLLQPNTWKFVVAAIVGLMMAGGVAGTEEIDLYVQSGLILWIFLYGGIHLSVLIENRRLALPFSWRDWAIPAIGAAAMCLGGAIMLLTDPNAGFLLKIIIFVGALGLLVMVAGLFLKRTRNHDMRLNPTRQR